jgi:site-specific recombinase XerD
MRLLLEQPNRHTPSGQRDYALLLFLYNTGARVSEAVAVCRRDFQFTPPYQARLLGKGRKERFCPLWPDTVHAIKPLLFPGDSASEEPSDAAFRGTRRNPLTRHGATYILAKYATAAAGQDPTFPKRVSPHMLRHSCACALLQGGVDLTVIRDYLGHASIVTTSRYANSNLKLKRDALANFWNRAGLAPSGATPWKPTKSLFSYLAAL